MDRVEFVEKVQAFARLLEADQILHLVTSSLDCDANRRNSQTSVKGGLKYTKVDVGTSGKYMVENATGAIYGIKGYGQIHRGHQYGTLDTIHAWNWGEYTAVRKDTVRVLA